MLVPLGATCIKIPLLGKPWRDFYRSPIEINCYHHETSEVDYLHKDNGLFIFVIILPVGLAEQPRLQKISPSNKMSFQAFYSQ